MKSENNILEAKRELDLACADLGIEDIKYFPSPKNSNGTISDLAKHATIMLRNYKKHLDCDKTSTIEEIFID